jgi:cytochrome bd-type quinol oxidase subunit 1
MLWVFGAGGAALAAIWIGQQIDRVRNQGDQRWANRLAFVAMVACAAAFVWGSFTDHTGRQAEADLESHYRASPGSRY